MDAVRRQCHRGCVTRVIEADYLVVGAGATGMAFTDAVTGHADVRVALVDRRHGVSGHWLVKRHDLSDSHVTGRL